MTVRKVGDDRWLVQVQVDGTRKTKRVRGTIQDAEAAEKGMVTDLTRQTRRPVGSDYHESFASTTAPAEFSPQTLLRDFYQHRWLAYAGTVQSGNTRINNRNRWRYLLAYLGDRTLAECLEPRTILDFVLAMTSNEPLTFRKTLTGQFARPRVSKLKNATINHSLEVLSSVLNLAFREGVVKQQPRIDKLPEDDSKLVLAPTDEQYRALLQAAESLRQEAPYLPEVIAFACQTGLRRGEIFSLTWGSVDWRRGTIRIEQQPKVRMTNGEPWKPKGGKFREIPMSHRVKEILELLFRQNPHEEGDLVFPNQMGCPYYGRADGGSLKGMGRSYFYVAVEKAGLKNRVSFHGLRHKFAVDLLTAGVPITIVSELLGHSEIELTVKTYGRFSSDSKIKFDALKVFDRIGGRTDLPPVMDR